MEMTIKTMEKVLQQISAELGNESFQAVKTLINTYGTLTGRLSASNYGDYPINKYAEALKEHNNTLEGLYVKTNNMIWKVLENENYKDAHTLTYIAEIFTKSSRTMNHILRGLKSALKAQEEKDKEKKVEKTAVAKYLVLSGQSKVGLIWESNGQNVFIAEKDNNIDLNFALEIFDAQTNVVIAQRMWIDIITDELNKGLVKNELQA